jgi:hypothetical protein
MAVYELFVDQFLVLTQDDSDTNPKGASASNTLSIIDAAKNYRQFCAARGDLNFGQVAVARLSIRNLTATSFLDLHQGGHRSATPQSLSQYLIIGQVARPVEYESLEQELELSQSAQAIAAKACFSTLLLDDQASWTLVHTEQVAHDLDIRSAASVVVEDDDHYSLPLPTLSGPNAPECQ